MKGNMSNKFLAELIGTFFLVFIGTGSAVQATLLANGHVGTLGGFAEWFAISLAFGLTVMAGVYSLGKISGANFNPAVTIGLLVSGNLSLRDSIGYIIAQVIGAVLGSLFVFICIGPSSATIAALGATAPAKGVSVISAIIAELIGTYLLVLVVMGTAVDKKADPRAAGLAIGTAVALAIFVLGPITGGSINPARTFGPYLIDYLVGGGNLWGYFYIYIIGPIVGGILAALTYVGLASNNPNCKI